MNKNQLNNQELSVEITQILNNLKTSPAFAMSRGGRELFHTNFLAFILEQTSTKSNENEYGQLVKKSLLTQIFEDKNLPNNVPSNVKVFREKLNLDLIIIPIDDFPVLSEECDAGNPSDDSKEKQLKIVVIEAKLKSIPTIQQLNNYSKKLEKIINIDLFEGDDNSKLIIDINNSTLTIKKSNSTIEPNEKIKYEKIFYDCFLLAPKAFALEGLTPENNPKSNWKNLNWNQLFEKLKLVQANSNVNSSSKLSVFIQDYIESTNNVLDLITHIIKFAQKFIDKDDNVLSDLCKFTINDSFKRLKLHDLVGKVAYEFVAKKIYESFTDKEQSFYFKAFLSNSTPGFEIGFCHSNSDNKQEIGVGVQLQGSEYRHFIKKDFSDVDNPLIKIADINKGWLFDRVEGEEKARNFGKGKDKTEYKKFNKDRFLYLSRAVDLNFEELRKAFERSLEGASKVSKQEDFKNQQNQWGQSNGVSLD